MKDLKQLIAEQKREFDEKFVKQGDFGDKQIPPALAKRWHTTSLKSLLLALRDGVEDKRRELDFDGYNSAISDISTLITEAIISLEE